MKAWFGFVLLGLLLSSGATGQTIYRCIVDGQSVFSQQPCAEDADEIEIRPAYVPDGTGRAGLAGVDGVEFRRKTCQIRSQTGTAEAIVELENMTDSVKSGELRIQFISGGQIIGVHRMGFTLGPWRKDTFSRLGPLGVNVDRCEYSFSLNSP